MCEGLEGEYAAMAYLRGCGHTILHHRWRSGHLEIDIVSRKDGVLHFVEVKSSYSKQVTAADRVGRAKQRNMTRAAAAYLRGHPVRLEVVFDIITVALYEGYTEIDYIEQAFLPIF